MSFAFSRLQCSLDYNAVADLGERPGGPPPPPPLFWVKKEEMTEGRKADRASKTRPGPHLSSKSGSATAMTSSQEDM